MSIDSLANAPADVIGWICDWSQALAQKAPDPKEVLLIVTGRELDPGLSVFVEVRVCQLLDALTIPRPEQLSEISFTSAPMRRDHYPRIDGIRTSHIVRALEVSDPAKLWAPDLRAVENMRNRLLKFDSDFDGEVLANMRKSVQNADTELAIVEGLIGSQLGASLERGETLKEPNTILFWQTKPSLLITFDHRQISGVSDNLEKDILRVSGHLQTRANDLIGRRIPDKSASFIIRKTAHLSSTSHINKFPWVRISTVNELTSIVDDFDTFYQSMRSSDQAESVAANTLASLGLLPSQLLKRLSSDLN